MISHRWAKANNKYLNDFNLQQPSSYFTYLHANNLCGWAMSQPQIYGNFEWILAEGVSEEWVQSLPDNGPEGYNLEVDL